MRALAALTALVGLGVALYFVYREGIVVGVLAEQTREPEMASFPHVPLRREHG